MKIIFALGNPEPEYTGTRHNIGFEVLNTLADQYGAKWADKSKFDSKISEIEINQEKVILVKPTTYYNETGIAARKLNDFYKVNPENDLLIIHDDLSIPFGMIRVRKKGGDAGNNGIKSINEHLNDADYIRIKIGIDNELHEKISDSGFVLSRFNQSDKKQLVEFIIPQTIDLIGQFIEGNIELKSFNVLK